MNPDDQEPTQAPQAPDRKEEHRADVPQNEAPVQTEGTDTGTPQEDTDLVEGRHNDDLPTENDPSPSEGE